MTQFNDDWRKEREQKRTERDMRQFARRMASPVARQELFQLGEAQAMHVASLALALEALEDLLVGRGLLDPDELMDCMELLARRKAEQAAAAAAAQGSGLIAQV